MKVPYLSLNQQWSDIRKEALLLIDEVLTTGKYIEHEIVESLEVELARKLDVKHVVLVNSGTDALMLGLYSLGIKKNDEVLTVPNSFIASVSIISPKFKEFGLFFMKLLVVTKLLLELNYNNCKFIKYSI